MADSIVDAIRAAALKRAAKNKDATMNAKIMITAQAIAAFILISAPAFSKSDAATQRHLNIDVVNDATALPETADGASMEIDRAKATAITTAAKHKGIIVETTTVPYAPDGRPMDVTQTRTYLASIDVGDMPKTPDGIDLGIDAEGLRHVGHAGVVEAHSRLSATRGKTLSFDVDIERFAGAHDGFDILSFKEGSVQLPNIEHVSFTANALNEDAVVAVRKHGKLFLIHVD